MYSRYHDRRDASIRIPAHYSGCAFSETHREESPSRFLDVAKPTPLHAEGENEHRTEEALQESVAVSATDGEGGHEEAALPIEGSPSDIPKREDRLQTGTVMPFLRQLLGNLGGVGKDNDHILILGLILLLLQGERDHDMVLWLILLLLCG